MKRLILAGLAALLAGCATTNGLGPKVVTAQEVVDMAKSGMAAEAIIQKIKESHTAYLLSASELIKLHDQGVPDMVLDYMLATQLEAVRDEEARRAFFYRPPPYWYYGRYYYYPWW